MLSESKRDAVWENDFLNQFPKQSITADSGGTRMGPDHWPYLFVRHYLESKEPVHQVFDWLSKQGAGLALNAHKEVPDYVFTYGMVWHFKETGVFQLNVEKKSPDSVVFEEGQEIISGPPSLEYIPQYARDVFKQFFSDQGVHHPRWIMVSGCENDYNLCFSVESLGCPPQREHLGVVESLSWFFPNHFSIVLISEEHLPSFYDLDEH